jgi:hypothetical protein
MSCGTRPGTPLVAAPLGLVSAALAIGMSGGRWLATIIRNRAMRRRLGPLAARRCRRTDARKAWGDGSPRSLLPMLPAPAQKAQRSALVPRDADGPEQGIDRVRPGRDRRAVRSGGGRIPSSDPIRGDRGAGGSSPTGTDPARAARSGRRPDGSGLRKTGRGSVRRPPAAAPVLPAVTWRTVGSPPPR